MLLDISSSKMGSVTIRLVANISVCYRGWGTLGFPTRNKLSLPLKLCTLSYIVHTLYSFTPIPLLPPLSLVILLAISETTEHRHSHNGLFVFVCVCVCVCVCMDVEEAAACIKSIYVCCVNNPLTIS